jgi:NAD(P)-dependent dehydrogenase (short-subunit alcohol dehydrogenase family)
MQLSQKSILITGGATRVGLAITRELMLSGAHIFCHYNANHSSAKKLQLEAGKRQRKIETFSYDLSRKEAPKRVVDECIQRFGKIDILINNAALFYKTPIPNVTYEEWDELHTLNLRSVFFLSQETAKHLLAQKSGKIINIGDAGALSPFPAYLPYSITKAGVNAMTVGLAKALAPHVQVNCVNPGPVLAPVDSNAETQKKSIEQTLLKREGSPQDVAKTVRFLLESTDYITGAIIPVDGGRQIR